MYVDEKCIAVMVGGANIIRKTFVERIKRMVTIDAFDVRRGGLDVGGAIYILYICDVCFDFFDFYFATF